MTEVAKSPTAEEAAKLIGTYLAEFRSGGPNRKAESIAIGRQCGLKLEGIEARWAREELLISPPLSPTGNVAEKPIVATLRALTDWTEFCQSTSEALASGEITPLEAETLIAEWDNGPEAWKDFVEKTEEPKATVTLTGKDGTPFVFHPSDHAGADQLPPVTIEEKERLLEELADLSSGDPIAYTDRKKFVAKRLETTIAAIDKSVKLILASRPKADVEQSQATKVMAIGLGSEVRLWHSPQGLGYASVFIEDRWQNHRIKSTGFEQYLRFRYGEANQAKVGDHWVPQVPGANALKDAMLGLEGYARHNGPERKPALRVGANNGAIWVDLGRPEWNAVKITPDGWSVKSSSDIPFIRTGHTLPLPIPVPDGDINDLRKVLNVRKEDFILCVAWELQALNPDGACPILGAEGESESGKTTVCKLLRNFHDPNDTGLRKIKTVEDLFIAARNNHSIGLDNLSVMPADFADALCTLCTGIAVGKRAHYTDDEEHAFVVQRPVIFNGIPTDLAERGDLASRTIKLEIPTISTSKRLGDDQLKAMFAEMWPRCLGALFTGIAGALRNWRSIKIGEPARLADFEKFAEAGCRAMGFAPMEFVDAYLANRQRSMAGAAEASAIGRAIMAFMAKHAEGFEGKMEELLKKLQTYRRGSSDRDWPKDATRLAGFIRRVIRPLDAAGIEIHTGVDLRPLTQKGITVRWKTGAG